MHSMAKVTVDKEKCVGCSACVAIAPEIFELRDGKSHVKQEEVSDELAEKATQAASGCPVQAITIS